MSLLFVIDCCSRCDSVVACAAVAVVADGVDGDVAVDNEEEEEENQSNAFSISVFDQRYGPCEAACERRLF